MPSPNPSSRLIPSLVFFLFPPFAIVKNIDSFTHLLLPFTFTFTLWILFFQAPSKILRGNISEWFYTSTGLLDYQSIFITDASGTEWYSPSCGQRVMQVCCERFFRLFGLSATEAGKLVNIGIRHLKRLCNDSHLKFFLLKK